MSIRTLRPDEPLPPGEPRRYLTLAGYVRLRWLVGPQEYVEAYEHRVVMGRPDGHVHHLDGDKANNDPTNLVVLTASEHQHEHDRQAREAGRYQGRAIERERAARREALEAWWARVAEEHAAGASTAELGRRYGKHHTNISRGLRRRGYAVAPRPGFVR